MTWNKKYLLPTILLFVIEFLIALFVRDAFVRPFVGDFLAVLFVYYLLRLISNIPHLTAAVLSLFIAYILEIMQCFNFIEKAGLSQFIVLKGLLGTSFSWGDIGAYTLGAVFILVLDFETKL